MNGDSPKFAVLQTDETEMDPVVLARLLTEPLDVPLADLVTRVAQTRGILAEGLGEAQAHRCADSLTKGGVASRVVPNEALVDLPPVVVLRSAQLNDCELQFTTFQHPGGLSEGSVAWADFLWLDCVSIQIVEEEEFEDWDISFGSLEYQGMGNEGPPRAVRFKNRRAKVERPRQIDLVSRQPRLWLQIREEDFQFAATGVALQPTRRENMHELAAALGQRATAARLGLGMKWFSDQAPFRESRMRNPDVHYSNLRWQLTRLKLDF